MREGHPRAFIGREVQLPRILLRPLGWSDSAQSLYQAGLPIDRRIVLTVQHPRPHVPPSPPRPSPPPAPASTSRVPTPLLSGFSSTARAAYELPTAPSIWLLLASGVTVFSSSMSADAMGRSGSFSRRGGRFLWAEAATTRPRTRVWQVIYAAPLMELLLVSPRPPSRDAGGPAVGPRVPGRSDFGTQWDRGLLL